MSINGPLKLSDYEIECRTIGFGPFRPFGAFSSPTRNQRSPSFYRSYNMVKHSRSNFFSEASLENVLRAVDAVFVLLDAQFGKGYHPTSMARPRIAPGDEIFWISKLPVWTSAEEYDDFNWTALKAGGNPCDPCAIPILP